MCFPVYLVERVGRHKIHSVGQVLADRPEDWEHNNGQLVIYSMLSDRNRKIVSQNCQF